jgi:hypothetical protein
VLERLAAAHLRGCAAPGERYDWLIEDKADSADLRARCIRAAATRWNWEAQAACLTELYATLQVSEGA